MSADVFRRRRLPSVTLRRHQQVDALQHVQEELVASVLEPLPPPADLPRHLAGDLRLFLFALRRETPSLSSGRSTPRCVCACGLTWCCRRENKRVTDRHFLLMFHIKRRWYLALDALLGDEGLQGAGLRVLRVTKVQDLCGTQTSLPRPAGHTCGSAETTPVRAVFSLGFDFLIRHLQKSKPKKTTARQSGGFFRRRRRGQRFLSGVQRFVCLPSSSS